MKEVNLQFVHSSSMGYGRYGSMLARYLRREGVAVYDHLPSPGNLYEDNGYASKKCNVAVWVSVPTHAKGWWKSQHPMISSMWEFTRLPESFRSTMHNFERVIVPSPQNVELFGEYHDDVVLVPLGVDPEVWHYRSRTPPANEFRFLIGGSGARKGTDLVYRAFKTLWPTEGSWGDGPIPTLIFKSPKPEDYYGERIQRVGGRISAQEEVDLYASAHCYLQPSRGEGFGLQPAQAIAQGCPTILTNAHGHESFAHLGYGLSTSYVPAAFSVYGDAGQWWEPNFDELCEYMLYVYENYDAAEALAEQNSQKMLAEFTWQNTARKFIDAVGSELLETPFDETEEWFAPEERLYQVVVREPFKSDICGTVYLFEPGRIYYEQADVLRILFETGKLDPACLTQMTEDGNAELYNEGLLPHQVAKIPDYSAAMGWCPTCEQKLGSGPRRSDVLMAELEAS